MQSGTITKIDICTSYKNRGSETNVVDFAKIASSRGKGKPCGKKQILKTLPEKRAIHYE
ncbi:MAG: hypothetical protein GQ565_01565 [Candidatus Aegiribacteria sp.]|nr:hypothetical protein [Candidatus Aegiribacteria sp.]